MRTLSDDMEDFILKYGMPTPLTQKEIDEMEQKARYFLEHNRYLTTPAK